MTKSFALLATGLLGLFASTARAESCGDAIYDPNYYICHPGNFLCPVINGEPLSYCNGACYSRFMYTCVNSVTLQLLPQLPAGTAFSLSVSNPQQAVINNAPLVACGNHIFIGPPACASYCPAEVVGEDLCRTFGNVTGFVHPGGMNVMVPGGQAWYLDPYWNVGYTTAHSAYIPPGSTLGGIVAFQGGGWVNLNPGATGWMACPPTSPAGGGRWNLVARNNTNAPNLGACYGVNLKVTVLDSYPSAWQYT